MLRDLIANQYMGLNPKDVVLTSDREAEMIRESLLRTAKLRGRKRYHESVHPFFQYI